MDFIRRLEHRSEGLEKTLDLLLNRLSETKQYPQAKKPFESLKITRNPVPDIDVGFELKGISIYIKSEFKFSENYEPFIILSAYKAKDRNQLEIGRFIIEQEFLADFVASVSPHQLSIPKIHLNEVDEYSNTYKDLAECISFLLFVAA